MKGKGNPFAKKAPPFGKKGDDSGVVKKKDGWYFGKQGPFKSKAEAVAASKKTKFRKGAIDQAKKMPPWMGKKK